MSDITLIPAARISSTGLDAETRRMEVIANNVANAETTKGINGSVFRRRQVIFAEKLAEAIDGGSEEGPGGVDVADIVDDQRDPRKVYRPGHPDADVEGFVTMPNISPVEEMVDMMSASRAYEANLAAIRMSKDMASRALDIGK